MQEEFVVLDTTAIQIDSLVTFMAKLGFSFNAARGSFKTDNDQPKGSRSLRFSTAQRLHNATMEDWKELVPGWYTFAPVSLPTLALNGYQLQELYATKLVKKTKFLHARKGGGRITLNSPMVKPAHPMMTALLGLA